MKRDFSEIRFEIETLFLKNKLDIAKTKNIYLPTLDFEVYKEMSEKDGYALSWWGIPILETKGTGIFFITENAR